MMLPNLTDRNLLLLGISLVAIAAWCTIGYHHPDEHFQIWEFANYKLGHIPASVLPWEFPEQMRPGLQPFLAYLTVRFTNALGLYNPFIAVFIARLACGAAAIWVYWQWCAWLERDLNSASSARWLRIGVLFFWLMPYLHVRFSSENTATICFFGGLLLLVQQLDRNKNGVTWRWMAAGLLLGLSFFFRYQMAFACIGLGAWLIFWNRPGLKAWAALGVGATLSVSIGLFTDYWMYDDWVFAPYNYFFSNIVEGKASNFGVSPFWWYLTEMPIALVPPLSIILLLFAAFGIWKKPAHVFSWCLLPFVLAHSMVAHKEVRFLFPMALPFFFFAVAGWEASREEFKYKLWHKSVFKTLLWVNGLILVFRILMPAKEMAAYARFLWNWEEDHPRATVYYVKEVPAKNYPLNMPFYGHSEQCSLSWYTDPAYRNDTTALRTGDLMFFTQILEPIPVAPPGFALKREFAYYPNWVLFYDINDWQERTRIWAVYSLEKRKEG